MLILYISQFKDHTEHTMTLYSRSDITSRNGGHIGSLFRMLKISLHYKIWNFCISRSVMLKCEKLKMWSCVFTQVDTIHCPLFTEISVVSISKIVSWKLFTYWTFVFFIRFCSFIKISLEEQEKGREENKG